MTRVRIKDLLIAMIHTHNDNSVNFLSPGSGGRVGGEDFGDHLVVRGT